MAQSETDATDGQRTGPRNKDQALTFEVSKNGEGVSVSVYRGMDLVEETWRTWSEIGVEPRSEGSVSNRLIFQFEESLVEINEDANEEDAE